MKPFFLRFAILPVFVKVTAASVVAAFFFVATLFGQESKTSADWDALTTVPVDATKAELLEFQATLTQAGQNVAPVDAERFLQKASNAFYESTKAFLALDLESAERAEYTERFAQILASQALQEAVDSLKNAEKMASPASGDAEKVASETPNLGPKYVELTELAADALRRYKADSTDSNRATFLSVVDATFAVRFRFARLLPTTIRDDAFAALVSDAISFALAYPENGEKTFELVMSIRAFSPDLGAEALDVLCESFEASRNPALLKPIQTLLGRRRFARLPGGELKFEGLLLKNGEFKDKFNWENYKEKLVLVEFWATWCGPCRQEFPKLKEVYAKYRDRGLEIVGYSIDQDVEKLKSFVVENELPWQIVSQTASVAAGFVGLYDYYAINGVPELILIGRDGKVIQTDARGDKLTAALETIFAEEDAKNAEETPETSIEQPTSAE